MYRRIHRLIGRREEKERVYEALQESKVAVIHGGIGEGKSRLAAEVASQFPPLQAYIDLEAGTSRLVTAI